MRERAQLSFHLGPRSLVSRPSTSLPLQAVLIVVQTALESALGGRARGSILSVSQKTQQKKIVSSLLCHYCRSHSGYDAYSSSSHSSARQRFRLRFRLFAVRVACAVSDVVYVLLLVISLTMPSFLCLSPHHHQPILSHVSSTHPPSPLPPIKSNIFTQFVIYICTSTWTVSRPSSRSVASSCCSILFFL